MVSKLLIVIIIIIIIIDDSNCQFETWMKDWSSNDAINEFGVNISDSTIFDIVFPGANNAGMSFDPDSDIVLSPSSSDSYKNQINTFNTDNERMIWSERQQNSIIKLLESGVRFLDLKFQCVDQIGNNDTDQFIYYSYNGILGRDADSITGDIVDFLDSSSYDSSQEMVLIYIRNSVYNNQNEFISCTSDADADLEELLDIFVSAFTNTAANQDIGGDITIQKIGAMTNEGTQIVMFIDECPSDYDYCNFFYNANDYLFNSRNSTNNGETTATYGQLDELSEVRSFVIGNIRFGWPDDKLNLIYWTLDIGTSFTEQFIYSGWQQFSSSLNNELSTVINTYPKLWFANVIIVDFFETSDIMEQIILLNYQYSNCRDTHWGNNNTEDSNACPYKTGLSSQYFKAGITPVCNITAGLQDNCTRSCGACSSLVNGAAMGNPGDPCIDNSDCNGPLYSTIYDNSDGEGVCWIRPNGQRYIDNIPQESFCQSVSAEFHVSCTNYTVKDKCDSSGSSGIDLSSCSDINSCSAHWQCKDGYCNTEYGFCMELAESIQETPAPTSPPNERYNFIESEGAEQMLKDVAPFRPGDYESAPNFTAVDCGSGGIGPSCLLDNMDANPYIASLLGFAIIPFIMAILLCFCYTVGCCPCWCCCDQCSKKCCCCHKVMKDPANINQDLENEGSACKQWTPFALLATCLIIIVWACIEGIVNNSEMHDHIFGPDNSVKAAVNHLFDEVIGRFESVVPTTEFVIDQGMEILDDVFDIVENTTDSVDGVIDDLYDALDILQLNYSNGINISSTFINPFNTSQSEDFTIECPYCSIIGEEAQNIKDQLNSTIGGQFGQIDSLLNETKSLVGSRDQIQNLTSQCAEYDQQYREQPAFIFFCLPMGLLIFVILGVIMKNKWCFKLEWCCAMYCCGIPIMLLSWPFIFFAVLWGDLCVRLDDFEQNMAESQIGELAGLDNASMQIQQGLELVNTCFTGGSPLDLFTGDNDTNDSFAQYLNWDQLRNQLDEQLDVDITGMLDEIDDITSFKTEIDTLSVAEFESVVDEYIASANAIGDYCGCGGPNQERPFTKSNLYGDGSPEIISECANYIYYTGPNRTYNDPYDDIQDALMQTTPVGGFPPAVGYTNPPTPATPPGFETLSPYWRNITIQHGSDCFYAYINASAAIQVEFSAEEDAKNKIASVKRDADRVFDVYDEMYGIAVDLEQDISSITCLVEPLFDQFDVIIDNFTNCGFLGEAYGNFKEAGCVNLFDDWYKIARALAIIAYISIFIVFLSLCMDYIYGPVKKRFESFPEDELAEEQAEVDMAQANPGGVELVTPYGAKPHFSDETPQGYNPHRQSAYNFDDAPASSYNGRTNNALSVGSYSSGYPTGQPAPPSEPPPASSYNGSYRGPISKPIVAESDVQEYSINFDNDPAANKAMDGLGAIAQGNESDEDGDGIRATGLDREEPVVPGGFDGDSDGGESAKL